MEMLDSIYKSYYGTSGIFDTKTKQMQIPKDKFIERIKKEKEMIAKLIVEELKNVDNFTEFSNTFYLGNEVLFPSISESLIDMDKSATLISPHVHNFKDKNGIKTIKTKITNPFYVYGELITPKLINDLKDVGCFISEINHSRLMECYRAWTSFGVPCVFAMSGNLDGRFKNYSSTITDMFNKNTKDNKLDYKVTFDYDSKTNCVAKIYTMKRK